jgi:TRAP-type transport system small permease protein
METHSPSPAVRVADRLDRLVAWMCHGFLLVTGLILMGAMTANVLARYALSTGGFDWAEEVPEQVFPWFIMAGVALAVQHRGHVAVEWLLAQINRTATRAVLIAGHLLVLVAYIFVTTEALKVADIVFVEKSPVLGVAKTYGYWAIAFGGALIVVSTFADLIRLIFIGPEALERLGPPEATS